jgi:hypothetical protein
LPIDNESTIWDNFIIHVRTNKGVPALWVAARNDMLAEFSAKLIYDPTTDDKFLKFETEEMMSWFILRFS